MNSFSSPGMSAKQCWRQSFLACLFGLLDALFQGGDEVPPDVTRAVHRLAAPRNSTAE
jgi:hypothetical protein